MRVVGWVLLVLSLFLMLISFVAADCGGPLDPCTFCGDGDVQYPNDDGIYEQCDGSAGYCAQGLVCNENTCLCIDDPTDPCNYNGDCQGYLGEDYLNCPSDCDPPCEPACAGRACGDDGCGGSCGSCSAPAECNYDTGQCCAPSCPLPSEVNCGTVYRGDDGCGGYCNVRGNICEDGYCVGRVLRQCVECVTNSDCLDTNGCTLDSCVGGECFHEVQEGQSCVGGTCDANGDCVTSCAAGLTDCGGACVDTMIDDANCGGCGNICGEQQECYKGLCVCADGTVQECYPYYDGTPGVGACTWGEQTCSNGAFGDCVGAGQASSEVCANSVDDDCDGATDGEDPDCWACTEDVDCDDTNVCTADSCNVMGECENTATNAGVACDADGVPGTCKKGACVASCTSSPETCNGIDDDCDGRVDEGELCSGDRDCAEGTCVCPDGSTWNSVECVPDCTDVCDAGEVGCADATPWSCALANDGCLEKIESLQCANDLPLCHAGGCVELNS